MQPQPNTKGKRRIVKTLGSDVSDVNISQYQKIVKRANNCKATSWKCGSCSVPQINRCQAKAQNAINTMAFKKYHDRPEFRKEQEKIDNEKTIKKIINRM